MTRRYISNLLLGILIVNEGDGMVLHSLERMQVYERNSPRSSITSTLFYPFLNKSIGSTLKNLDQIQYRVKLKGTETARSHVIKFIFQDFFY